MKKIFGIAALMAIFALVFSSCDNKPPYVRLAAAIDSINAQYNLSHDTDQNLVTYERFDNVVTFHFDYPERIEEDVFSPIAEHIKQNFLLQFITDDEFGVATEVIDAHSNVVIALKGLDDTKFDILIVNNEIVEAYEALHAAAGSPEAPAETPEGAELQEEQRELLEGNVTTL